MANKKISELSARVGLSANDLIGIGDPDTGFLYKCTAQQLLAVISLVTNINPLENVYTADGTEGASFTFTQIINTKIIGVYRGGVRMNKVLSLPASGQYVITLNTGVIQFISSEPLVAGEKIIADTITIS